VKKYAAIAKDLSTLIDTKDPGDRIPSEQELAQTYGVSAMTVRRAIQILTNSGRIEGIPGRGTFVRAPQVHRSLSSMSFTETMQASGRTPSSRLIAAALRAATPEERELLGLLESASVYQIDRVRFGDDVALCFERATLPAARFPGLLGQNLERSLYQTLRTKFQVVVAGTRFEVAARVPDAAAAVHLGIDRRTPCLETRTLSRDADGAVVERTVSLYRGDVYQLTLDTGAFRS